MLRFIATRWVKIACMFQQVKGATANDLTAGPALSTAVDRHTLAAKLTKEADQMDARIKEMDSKHETGFWECEGGHESNGSYHMSGDAFEKTTCIECYAPAKFIKRDLMTGQEKYEFDRERGEAQKIADEKRQQAKATEQEAAESEKTTKYFRGLAESKKDRANNPTRVEVEKPNQSQQMGNHVGVQQG
jgi:hypothetical protein